MKYSLTVQILLRFSLDICVCTAIKRLLFVRWVKGCNKNNNIVKLQSPY